MSQKTNNGPKNLTRLLKNKVVLITGGAGSIGTSLTKKLLEYPIQSLRVLDIDEYGLFKLGRVINDKRLRLLLGSIIEIGRAHV